MSKEHSKGMSLIVKTVTRLTVGLIFLYGIYIISHGHVSPGGGFAGGVIIALSFIHLMLAYGKEEAFKRLSLARASFFESFGALLFLGVGLLGFIGGYFFLNVLPKGEHFRLFSAGIIPVCNLAISFKVGAGLFLIFAVLVMYKFVSEEDKR
ncbi:MAG: MnhB domain-containing protein [Candidatus Omnitrophota bacterium]